MKGAAGQRGNCIFFQQVCRQLRTGVHVALRQNRAPALKIWIQIKAGVRQRAWHAKLLQHAVQHTRARAMQACALRNVLRNGGISAVSCQRGMLHRRRHARPNFTGHNLQRCSQLAPGGTRRQDGHAKAPATQRQVLAQTARDHRALGIMRSHRRRAARVVRRQAVDFVAYHHQAVAPRKFCAGLQRVRILRAAQRIAGRVEQQHFRALPIGGSLLQCMLQTLRIQRVAGSRIHGHRNNAAPRQLCLRCIRNPRGCGQQHGAIGSQRQRQQQRFAARPDHHLLCGNCQPKMPPVKRSNGGAQFRQAKHRQIAALFRMFAQRSNHRSRHGKPRLAKAQMQHITPGCAQRLHALVNMQRGRWLQARQAGACKPKRRLAIGGHRSNYNCAAVCRLAHHGTFVPAGAGVSALGAGGAPGVGVLFWFGKNTHVTFSPNAPIKPSSR